MRPCTLREGGLWTSQSREVLRGTGVNQSVLESDGRNTSVEAVTEWEILLYSRREKTVIPVATLLVTFLSHKWIIIINRHTSQLLSLLWIKLIEQNGITYHNKDILTSNLIAFSPKALISTVGLVVLSPLMEVVLLVVFMWLFVFVFFLMNTYKVMNGFAWTLQEVCLGTQNNPINTGDDLDEVADPDYDPDSAAKVWSLWMTDCLVVLCVNGLASLRIG